MQKVAHIAGVWLTASMVLYAQAKPSAALPATMPTQSLSDLPSAHMPAAPTTTGETRIIWTGAELTIDAAGEPMPEVLGRVARVTGMKISGGVPDEHLYGSYGPGSVQTVMAQLFEGLAINMMLVNESPTKPKELILTSRTGGPTPPSVRQLADGWQSSTGAQPVTPVAQQPQPATQTTTDPRRASTTQAAFPGLSAPPTENSSFTNVGNANVPQDPPTTTGNSSLDQPQSPNGVKTPEQIFEELRKRAAAAQPQ